VNRDQIVERNFQHWCERASARELFTVLDMLAAELQARALPGARDASMSAHQVSLYVTAMQAARPAEPIHSEDCSTRSE
jgi:hypothetical protein